MNLVQKLTNKKAISPPSWLPNNLAYLTVMGSEAYGVSTDNSDKDYYGFCIPPRYFLFPHEKGYIQGFGEPVDKFDQWQEHGVKVDNVTYDFTVFNITKYFQLLMENNPNIIDSLFTPMFAVQCSTPVGQLVREHRKLFLHKGAWFKFKGYAYSQLHKMDSTERDNPKRQSDIDTYGYDLKFGYHLVRLMNEVEQILTEGDLDLLRNREQLKSIRRGEWTKEQVTIYFSEKENQLEKAYNESVLPNKPDKESITQLLLNCLEQHYGTIPVQLPNRSELAIIDIMTTLRRYGY